MWAIFYVVITVIVSGVKQVKTALISFKLG